MEEYQFEEEVRKLMEEQLAKNAAAKAPAKKETPVSQLVLLDCVD